MIAISYRREDSLSIAGRLYDRLQAKFGRKNVFMDFDSIPAGVDFREQIEQTIQRSQVVVAVIGQDWFGQRSDGSRRIDNPNDFVRLEIEYALKRRIPVIPLLVNNRSMPTAEELPETISSFAFRNALPLDSGRDFHNHVDRVISGIRAGLGRSKSVHGEAPAGPEPSSRSEGPTFAKGKTWLWLAGLLAAVVIAAFFLIRQSSVRPQKASPSESLTLALTPAPTQAMVNLASATPARESVAATTPLDRSSTETAATSTPTEASVPTAAPTVSLSSAESLHSEAVSSAAAPALVVITLSADRQGHSVKTAFPVNTPTIYALLKTVGLKRGDDLRASWVKEGPNETVVEEGKMRIFHDIDDDDYFAWRPIKAWTPGKYRLDVYLNGERAAHSQFTILKP